jgi:hypothetical protein
MIPWFMNSWVFGNFKLIKKYTNWWYFCPKLEVWFNGLKRWVGAWGCTMYLIYPNASKVLRGWTNGSVNCLKGRETNDELNSSRGCRQGNSTWVAQGRKSPVFIHREKAIYMWKELYYMAIRKYIVQYQNQTIEVFRRNVWGTMDQQ